LSKNIFLEYPTASPAPTALMRDPAVLNNPWHW